MYPFLPIIPLTATEVRYILLNGTIEFTDYAPREFVNGMQMNQGLGASSVSGHRSVAPWYHGGRRRSLRSSRRC